MKCKYDSNKIPLMIPKMKKLKRLNENPNSKLVH